MTAKYFEQQIIEDIDLSTDQYIDYQSTKKKLDLIIEQLPPKRKEVFIKSRFRRIYG